MDARLISLGFVGEVIYRCDLPEVARVVDRLLRLAPFAGVGAARQKGLGVTRVTLLQPPADAVARSRRR